MMETGKFKPVHSTVTRPITSSQPRAKLSTSAQPCSAIDRRNTEARELYYRNKNECLIRSEGIDIDVGLNDDLSQILEEHWNEGNYLEVLDLIGSSHIPENSYPGRDPKKNTKVKDLLNIFIEEQIKASTVKGACSVRWHPLMIRLALRLHMTSASVNRAPGNSAIIKLPSGRTLFDYSHLVKLEVGIDGLAVSELHNLLEKEYAEDSHQRYHVLLMDEISMAKNLVFSRATGELTGFVKLSEIGKEIEKLEVALEIAKEQAVQVCSSNGRLLDADEAQLICQKSRDLKDYGDVVPDVSDKFLSFTVVGITNGVRTVVASYGLKNFTTESLNAIVWTVIGELERANIYILGLVCDGHPVNRAFIKKQKPSHKPLPSGNVYSTVNLEAKSREIFFFSNVPHLLKTFRNCFFNSECGKKTRCLKKNGQFIRWPTIVTLFNDEKDRELRTGIKLNAQEVYLNDYSGMKASYAAGVLHASVGSAIEAMGYPDTEETVEFICRANEFFDCLNGCSSAQAAYKRNSNLAPYRSVNDSRFKIMYDYLEYLLSWSKVVEHPRFCISFGTLTGIEMTIHSFEKCCKFMFSKGAEFIEAGVFCQDPLQSLEHQRTTCGDSINPCTNPRNSTESSTLAAPSTSIPLLKRKRGMDVEKKFKIVRID